MCAQDVPGPLLTCAKSTALDTLEAQFGSSPSGAELLAVSEASERVPSGPVPGLVGSQTLKFHSRLADFPYTLNFAGRFLFQRCLGRLGSRVRRALDLDLCSDLGPAPRYLCDLGQVTQPLCTRFLIGKCGIAIVSQKAVVKVKLGHICKVPDPHQVPNKCYLPPHSPHISGTRDHCSFSLGCIALARAQGI